MLGERKPNCVIIDEIDGATGGAEGHSAIAALIKIINAGSSKQQAGVWVFLRAHTKRKLQAYYMQEKKRTG